MKERLRQFLQKHFPTWWAIRAILWADQSYLQTSGWMHCWKEVRPCRLNGTPLPYMNYTVIGLFEERLTKDLKLFEYGSGFSTLFFADLVSNVTSIEYDKGWYENLIQKAPSNVVLHYISHDSDGKYCRAIHQEDNLYDLVIIDGRDRVNCMIQATGRLTDRGVVVLDDSDRDRYHQAFEHARTNGFKALRLTGLKPTGFEAFQTTIFYRDGNCLGL